MSAYENLREFLSSRTTTELAGSAVACLVLCYIVQALFAWRRLAGVPAPSWTVHFSYLWLAMSTNSGKQYWIHKHLHKDLGPLVRIGPNEVVTNDPGTIKKISGTDERWARDPFYLTGKFNPYHDNLFSRLDPKEHKWAKSRTLAAYSGRETPDLEVGVNNLIETLIAKIASKYAAPTANSQTACFLDLGKTSCYFTLDVITRLAFGREFGYLEHEKDHYNFLGSLHDLWPQMSTCADVPWIRKFLFSKPFLTLLGPKTTDKAGFGALMGVAEHHVAKRFSPDAKPQQDMLGSMMKHGLNQTECETEGLFMIIAGTESTASAIRSALVHTITTPRVYKALKQEITKAMADGTVSSPISMVEARNLPYLRAVVYEGLRMRPPLIGYFPKVVPRGGEEILGHHLPAGTAIGTNMSAVLSSTDLFGPDADLFRPERFLELDEGRRKQMERDVELAFGNGQWMCVGKTIAFMEIYKSVFEILRHFDLQLLQPYSPSDVMTYGTFLESNLLLKVTQSQRDQA
ncbi:putative P450 monooxygenase [Aureobasidium pullulans]|nr:putative P450 monooxygenase [Aureobasidium pullulans]